MGSIRGKIGARRGCRATLTIGLGAALLLPSVTGVAEPPTTDVPVIQLSPDEERSFSTFLATYTARAGVTVVAEAGPRIRHLTDGQVAALPISGTPRELLQAVAAAYDYEVVKGSAAGKLLLLEKRYSDPNDLPSVTLAEAAQTLRDVRQLIDQFDPHVDLNGSSLMTPFMNSLSPDQRARMQTDDVGLNHTDLSSDQQVLVQQMLQHCTTKTMVIFCNTLQIETDILTNPRSEVGWNRQVERAHTPHFGCRIENAGPIAGFWPLSGLAGSGIVVFPVISLKISSIPTPADLTAPDLASASVDEDADTNALRPVTLRAALTTLSTQTTASGVHAPRFAVADSLADKTITLANPSAAAPGDIARGIATIYGLHVVQRSTTAPTLLDRPAVPHLVRIQELHTALRQTFPTPFLRAIHWDDAPPEIPMPSRDHPHTPRPNTFGTLQVAAVRKIRTEAEPELTRDKADWLPVSSLGNTSHSALAANLLVDLFNATRNHLSDRLPPYLEHGDDLILTGGRGPRMSASNDRIRDTFLVHFCYRWPTGRLVDAGVSLSLYLDDDTPTR